MPKHLSEYAPDDMSDLLRHPAQQATHYVVTSLIARLRECAEPKDYFDFEVELFRHLFECETRRSEARRISHRLRSGKALPADAPELYDGADTADPRTWWLEDRVYERIIRQLRSVGDALAWRVTGDDRSYITAVSSNASPGVMAGKEGLTSELAVAERLWNEEEHFALLHDLTNCLRIGDMTEFRSDGSRMMVEVKRGYRSDPKQTKRMQAAVDALTESKPLPGSDRHLANVDVDFATELRFLADALALAAHDGVCAMKVPGGRVLVACHLLKMATSDRHDGMEWIRISERKRAGALRRAGIDKARHHLTMKSVDAVSRQPTVVPWGIYPLEPQHRADLICDRVVLEVVMSVDEILRRAPAHGLRGETRLADANGQLASDEHVVAFTNGDRTLVAHSFIVNQLLGELICIDTFLDGIEQLVGDPLTPQSPVLTFRNEARVWR